MAIKLRDDNLIRSLKNDGFLPFYFVVGNDEFLMHRCMAALRQKVGEVVTLDFCESDDETVELELSSYSFSEKLIVIDNFRASEYDKKKRQLYAPLLEDIPYGVHVAVRCVADGKFFKVPQAAEGFSSLCPDSAMVICEKKKGSDLVKYVCAMSKKAGAEMSASCASRLIDLRGSDLYLLYGEVMKLASACGYTEITPQLVDRMCPRTTEDSVFDFIKEVERGNVKQALSILADIMETEKEPIAVLAAVSGSYVNLSRVNAGKGERVSRDTIENDFSYKKGDKAFEIAFDKGARFSTPKLDEIIMLLYDINKALISSSVDKNVVLEKGMVKLSMIMKENF